MAKKLPKDVEVLLKEAQSLYEKEGWGAAIRTYTKLLALIAKNTSISVAVTAAIYNNRGAAYRKTQAYDSALADLHKSLKLNPNDANAYVNRGSTYGEEGKYDLAITDFNKALKLRPNFALAYRNRGGAYNEKGEYDRAIVDLDKAVKLSPNDSGAYNNRGNTYNGKGEYDRAIADLDKAISLSQKNTSAYTNRGNAYYGKGEYDRAIADYSAALKIDPKHLNATHNRALAMSMKNHEAELEKMRAEYKKDILDTAEYTAEKEKYQQEADEIDATIKKRFVCLQSYAATVFVLVAAGIVGAILEKINVLTLLPLIGTASLCSFPFIWHIRTLKQDKARLMALSRDTYTKGILTNLINVNIVPEIQKELLIKLFDHHTQSGSAKLIIDLENNTKSDDGASNIIVQQLKEHLSDKKG